MFLFQKPYLIIEKTHGLRHLIKFDKREKAEEALRDLFSGLQNGNDYIMVGNSAIFAHNEIKSAVIEMRD